ncbi:MAG: ParB/RepB/Spo0J family partition protein [Candidatus Odinarchaeota archaeon]
MVKKNENSSDYTKKIIPIGKLYLDPKNPRRENPTKDLLDSVKDEGIINPLIVWLKNDNEFLISDGWERYQAGVITGLSEIPCYVYTNHIKALKSAKLESITNPWTKYQKAKFCKIFYDTCIEEGMIHEEALQRTILDLPSNKKTVCRYLRVLKEFPIIAQALLKKPRNRSKEEWDNLEHYNISFKKKILNISVADAMVQNLKEFSEEDICQIAVDLLGLNVTNAKKAIYRISQNPDIDPYDIITKIREGYNPNEILRIGSLIIEPRLKKAIGKYVSTRLSTPKSLIKELIEDWFLSTGRYSVVEIPDEATDTEIKSVSFKIRSYKVKFFLLDNYPIIKIEGKPSLWFSHREVREKDWNRYSAFPQYLKNFLNNLKIKLENKN